MRQWGSLVLLLAVLSPGSTEICDNADHRTLHSPQIAASVQLFNRQISVHVSNEDQGGFASISNGDPTDEVWLDRSFDNEEKWEGRLGFSTIPEGSRTVMTPSFNIDHEGKVGVIRACGKAGNRENIACTTWQRFVDPDSTTEKTNCTKNSSIEPLTDAHIASTVKIFGREIAILVSEEDNAGFARISNGDPTDEVWIDRSWDDGKSWEGRLGYSVIPAAARTVNTPNFKIDEGSKIGVIRACGKAGNRENIVCTAWHSATVSDSTSLSICAKVCDKDNFDRLKEPRAASTLELLGRQIAIMVSDKDNAVYGSISNGEPGDEIWLHRSWDGGRTWDGRQGFSVIPSDAKAVSTPVFNIDGDFKSRQIGVLRACGKPGNVKKSTCTPWTRGTKHSDSPVTAAATTLMMYYNDKGQWDTTGWWNAANCLTAIIDYMKVTGDDTYMYVIDETFEKNKNEFQGTFRNDFVDDTGWWGLAWVGAYDLTENQKYLDAAKVTADFMHEYNDSVCGGGVYWSHERKYKNAVTNELFIKLTAALHTRIPEDTKYLNWSTEVLDWFEKSGMINKENLINDGLNDQCTNNGQITWTYNQGIILGAYAELYNCTDDASFLERGRKIAEAAVRSSYLSPRGVLHEPCDHSGNDCGGDGRSFKGVFARNLGELNAFLEDNPFSDYIFENAKTIRNHRNSIDQYGLHYEGPFEFHDAATQHSALEMLTAAQRLTLKGLFLKNN